MGVHGYGSDDANIILIGMSQSYSFKKKKKRMIFIVFKFCLLHSLF